MNCKELMDQRKRKYYKWEFTLKDGSAITAKFTDKEIREMEVLYPLIKFTYMGLKQYTSEETVNTDD